MKDEKKNKQELIEELKASRKKIRQLEGTLKKSESRLRIVTERIHDIIGIMDKNGIFRFMTPSIKPLLGYEVSEMVGTNGLEYIHPEDLEQVTESLNRVMETGQAETTYRFRHHDGHYVALVGRGQALRNRGQTAGAIISCRYLTDCEKTEDVLKESEYKFRTLFEKANDAVFVMDEDTFIGCNAKTLEMFGCTREQIVGQSPSLFSPEFQPNGGKSFEQSQERTRMALQGQSQSFEWRHRRYDGTLFDAEVSLYAFKFAGKYYLQSIVRDITDRKRAEEALRESEELFSVFMDNLTAAVFIKDADSRLLFANRYLQDLFGWKDAIGQPPDKLLPPELAEPMTADDMRVLADGPMVIQERIRDTGGVERIFITHKFPIRAGEKAPLLGGIAVDITERVKTEKELADIKVLMQASFEQTPVAMVLASAPDGLLLNINRACRELLGIDIHTDYSGCTLDAIKPLWRDFDDQGKRIPWDERPLSLALKGITTKDREIAVLRRDGTLRWTTTNAAPIYNQAGAKIAAFVVFQNMTERKCAEEALKESEERYRGIIENIEDGYFEVNVEGRLTFFNEPLCRIFGYSREDLIDMNNRGYMTPATAKRVFQTFSEMYRTHVPMRAIDYEIVRRDGSGRHLELSASPIQDNAGTLIGFRGIARDMTERRQEEAEKEKLKGQLQQAQKMEAIGTLAGGIAHDFNNLLMAILGHVSLMRLDMDHLHPYYERLLQIEKQVISGANLTKRLLGFARGGRYEVKATNINDIIDKTASMFGRTKKEITIHTRLDKAVASVEVDQGQIEQVLMNLYVNAWQAMPGGGDIYLETRNVVLGENDVKQLKVKPGKYVKITVTDSGVGMDQKTKERIFDPFFTTKEMGKGTGLGLAMVYGIITGHEGAIHVYSEPGRGATFTIYLPVSGKEVVKDTTAAPHRPLKGTETILVVDDEKSVLAVSKDMLEALGYRVHTARGGQEALDIYLEKKGEIDMVILDLIMPGISGEEAFDRLRKVSPELKVLLSSGYSINRQAQRIMERGCRGFLQKPFHVDDLSRKVREVLER